MPPCSGEGNEDMISNLPDNIIGYILSFLSTEEAVRTSVLSKRWIYMWTFLTKLWFRDNKTIQDLDSFPKFVSRVLFHLTSTTIQDFCIHIHHEYDLDYSVLNGFRVKKMTVCLWLEDYSNTYSWPLFECHQCFFSFLEELVFSTNGKSCRVTVKLPSFACLPFLTRLNLFKITFTSSNEEFQELTLNFPLLREFESTYCTTLSGVKSSITIEAPLLETVAILANKFDIIRFSASHIITNFTYAGEISSRTILLEHQNIPCSKIHLDLYDPKDHTSVQEISSFIFKLLSFFINAEYLKLSLTFCRKGLHAHPKHYLTGIPAFPMLDYLKLDDVIGDALLGFLLKSPCLKTLAFKLVDYYQESPTFTTVPDCFVSSLKVVKFMGYFGSKRELSFAKFVMENAKVLERISFSFHYNKSCSEVEKAKETLSLLKTSFCSSTVIMEFSQ